MKISYRWEGDLAEAPMIGGYLLSSGRPRGGYLITEVANRGRRGGLGQPFYYLLVLTAERVGVETARQGPLWFIKWDSRGPRRRNLA